MSGTCRGRHASSVASYARHSAAPRDFLLKIAIRVSRACASSLAASAKCPCSAWSSAMCT
jgi:hypothetical protein